MVKFIYFCKNYALLDGPDVQNGSVDRKTLYSTKLFCSLFGIYALFYHVIHIGLFVTTGKLGNIMSQAKSVAYIKSILDIRVYLQETR